jgi:hypothetical protein
LRTSASHRLPDVMPCRAGAHTIWEVAESTRRHSGYMDSRRPDNDSTAAVGHSPATGYFAPPAHRMLNPVIIHSSFAAIPPRLP